MEESLVEQFLELFRKAREFPGHRFYGIDDSKIRVRCFGHAHTRDQSSLMRGDIFVRPFEEVLHSRLDVHP